MVALTETHPVLESFHPAVRTWFERKFEAPTDAQVEGWPLIQANHDVLIAAPTGSGKTLAAFLAGIDSLIKEAEAGTLEDTTQILYVSPLKALGVDIKRNLEGPLAEIRAIAEEMGRPLPIITTAVRSGDTTPSERARITRKPPHILITTPESLYLMLTAEKSRKILTRLKTLVVDEIHALVRDKRGSHFALSMARLDHVAERRPNRIGLSATQKPIDEIARFLVGSDRVSAAGRPDCQIVDRGHQRELELLVEVPPSEMQAVAPKEQWAEIYERIAELVAAHRTTLIFVNTRRLAERVAHNLTALVGKENVASHHGSLSKERRFQLEERLKSGEIRALVATASLELGIDVGSIDLVCQIGSPRSISTFLQRVGRSGHALGLTPRGRLFPTSRDELVECAALIRAVRAGRLDRVTQPVAPLDVLAQQIVAETASEDWEVGALFDLFHKATPYRELSRQAYDDVLRMLAEGVGDAAGGAPPLIHYDRINGMVRGRRGARMKSLTNGGTIPESGDYQVIAEPDDMMVGTVNEDWAIESMAGDVFLLGTTSWRIQRVESGRVRVQNAQGAPPTIPFWLGEGPGRTSELSEEVGRLRRDIVAGLDNIEALEQGLKDDCGLPDAAVQQLVDYIRVSWEGLGVMPSDTDVVFERFFDEAGAQHLVVHAPFGARINRAWGLALRKRFCVRFDFELQAAANDDAIVLSLGAAQSFPLEEAFHYLKADNAVHSVRQASLYSPVWGTRFRWNATRALAVPRQRGSKKVPPNIQRMISDDLLAAVFPKQVGCQENLSGPLEIPDHPLCDQTVEDCLREWMDIDGLIERLKSIESGEITLHAKDTVEPSPMAAEILNGKPYTFLDDAPLEERRTRAVMTRRTLPENTRDLGALDADAIARVREEAWPTPVDAEEVHDALLGLVAIADERVAAWEEWLGDLVGQGRAAVVSVEGTPHWFASENLELIRLLFPESRIEPELALPFGAVIEVEDREMARVRMLRGQAEALGPVTAAQISAVCGLSVVDVERGMMQVEGDGYVLRGRFSASAIDVHAPGSGKSTSGPDEFCDRRLLARIHKYTLDRLRREIEPVAAQDLMRFLLRWQHLTPETRLQGKAGLREAIRQLAGFEAPAASWERDLLPARVVEYHPSWLDELSLAGEVTWARLTPKAPSAKEREGKVSAASPSRVMPVTIAPRVAFPTLLAAVRGEHGSRPVPRDRSPKPEQEATSNEPATGSARQILELLRERGALFFDEIVGDTRRLASDVESGLRDLVARGLVYADGFEGLRHLAGNRAKVRRRRRGGTYGSGGVFQGSGPSGRWATVDERPPNVDSYEELTEQVAEVLLARYGVVFRDLLTRESITIPWRDLLRALRRLEARGTIRGGRFVTGFIGEQYALPEAVQMLRQVRREAPDGERVFVSAVDPCNLLGVVLPGAKVAARAGTGITLVDGAPREEDVSGLAYPRGGSNSEHL
jgi:ATP-dependent Lhr-like helicase